MKTIINAITYFTIFTSVNGFTTTTSNKSKLMRFEKNYNNINIIRYSTTEADSIPSSDVTVSPTSSTSVGGKNNSQAEYGKSIEMPNTFVRCGRCTASFALRPEDLGNGKGR